MAFPRRALLLLLLVATPALAGCNVRDWYNQEGWVTVELAPQGPRNSSLDEFQRVSVAIFGVNVRQVEAVQPKSYSFGTEPLLIDLVDKGTEGERVPLARFRTNLRATSEVTIRMEVVEVIDAAGNVMQICRPVDTVRGTHCFFAPQDGNYRYDQKPFAPPRGGEVVVGFPVAVKYAAPPPGDTRKPVYYLEIDPALITLTNHR